MPRETDLLRVQLLIEAADLLDEIASKIDKNYKSKGYIKLSSLKLVKNLDIDNYKSKYSSLKHIKPDAENFGWFKKSDLICYLSLLDKNDGYKWIEGLEIINDYRGYGLSKQILKFAIKNGANALSVNKNNKVAYKIYYDLGFRSDNNDHGSMIFMYLK